MGGHRAKAIHAVMMEDGIAWDVRSGSEVVKSAWGTDEVKSILDVSGKMFVSMHALNTPARGAADGPTEQMVDELREHDQMKQMYKLLDELLRPQAEQ